LPERMITNSRRVSCSLKFERSDSVRYDVISQLSDLKSSSFLIGTSKFGGWGDNYAYHIGDLSSVVLPGHEATVQTEKYRSWATALFESINTDRPRLRQPAFFWGPSLEERGPGDLDRVLVNPSKLPRISPDRDRKFDLSSRASKPRRPQSGPLTRNGVSRASWFEPR
jgi:hypothetical protein